MTGFGSRFKHEEWWAAGILFILLATIGFSVSTTGDNGDSVMHYLFSHHAFDHPENFLDHWAKPFFVLLSSPFAYFGFKGMILFNVLCVSLTGLFTYYIAKNLEIIYAILVFPLMLGAPLFIKLTFSGLTEYLFGLITVMGIFLVQKNKLITAVILVSTLPMVRSEGLIVLGVFGLYLLIEKKIRLLPLLFSGQLLYTLLGAIYHQDLFWVVNHIPYASTDSPYGSGGLFDFVFRLMYVVEKPLMLLLGIGLVAWLVALVTKKDLRENSTKYVLIAGTFVAIFLSHSIFWYLGIFNSMGLPRVLIVIVPMALVIIVDAIDHLAIKINDKKIKKGAVIGIVLVAMGFPFLRKDDGISYHKGMFTITDHNLIDEEVTPFIIEEFPNYHKQKLFFSNPYLSVSLNVDYFDLNAHMEMQHILEEELLVGTIVIWDNWFAITDGGIQLTDLKNHANLKTVRIFKRNEGHEEVEIVIFEAI